MGQAPSYLSPVSVTSGLADIIFKEIKILHVGEGVGNGFLTG